MKDSSFDGRSQGHFAAWAVAAIFLGLVAAPMLLSTHRDGRAPGIFDIGTPGATVESVPSSALLEQNAAPLTDWADHLKHERRNSMDDAHHDGAVADPSTLHPAM